MNKSILVIDTPSACIDCPCHFADENGTVVCGVKKKELLADDIEIFKPDWCPLKEIPKKKSFKNSLLEYDTDIHYEVGYNACIDEILKERDENEVD